ncbi:polysaccharide deacetylase family protein [Streptomyces sp. BE303]|uniref:polysaccharide deacetylase family protein n=1 Tax=Streptomyces sp. BE303 TaxID=3002528 RepID=UPI002E75C381|nr:polysaccharide deacetylase family protein [Streptomyces sp. BE303]MED7952046.1 polysaccharide deacetylase family protein [Streptomyces sp. BE303]
MSDLTRGTAPSATTDLALLQTADACSGTCSGAASDTGEPVRGGADRGKRSGPARRARSLRPSAAGARRSGLRTACAALLVTAVTGCGAAQGGVLGLSMEPNAPGTTPASGTPTAPGTPRSPAPSPRPTGSAGPASAKATPAGVPPSGSPAKSAALVRSTAHGGRTVALTFDDGPGPATADVLDVLAQYGVKATFCQIGPQATANPAMVRRILAAGHRLCDHTVHHLQPFAALAHDQQVQEIGPAKDMIVQAGGPGTQVPWFRAPGGGFTPANEQVAATAGMRSLTWTVDSLDWTKPGVAAIVANVQRELRPGGVVLMHDGGGDRTETIAALHQLLPWLKAQGYTFDFPAG